MSRITSSRHGIGQWASITDVDFVMSHRRVFSASAVSVLAYPVAYYIRSQRDRLNDLGIALSTPTKTQLREYFRPADLDRTRVVESDPFPIPAPPFCKTARRLGLDFPDLSLVAAITLDSVIASRGPLGPSLLFHELVHVVQFRLLGVKTFAKLYTRGFLDERSYDGIPLERCAYELERRFTNHSERFDVEAEVAAWIERDRF